jgi:hypothetical protein
VKAIVAHLYEEPRGQPVRDEAEPRVRTFRVLRDAQPTKGTNGARMCDAIN